MNGNGNYNDGNNKISTKFAQDQWTTISNNSEFNYVSARQDPNIIKPKKLLIHLVLFVLTFLTTWNIGGLGYSVSIMTILFAHEMGHYLMCRKYKIKATLPFFLPFPFRELNPFGTLGAVIRIGERLPTRKSIFDIGVAGPLSGLIFTVPVLIIGLKLSTIVETNSIDPTIFRLGESLLFAQLSEFILGHIPEGYEIMLHPVAYAGWVGLFVTALNLLPVGQLDGGHVLYALFGKRSDLIFKVVLSIFAIFSAIWYPGWFLFIILIIWFGYRHPPALYGGEKLDTKRKIIGYITFVIFILSFTPVPFYFNY